MSETTKSTMREVVTVLGNAPRRLLGRLLVLGIAGVLVVGSIGFGAGRSSIAPDVVSGYVSVIQGPGLAVCVSPDPLTEDGSFFARGDEGVTTGGPGSRCGAVVATDDVGEQPTLRIGDRVTATFVRIPPSEINRGPVAITGWRIDEPAAP